MATVPSADAIAGRSPKQRKNFAPKGESAANRYRSPTADFDTLPPDTHKGPYIISN